MNITFDTFFEKNVTRELTKEFTKSRLFVPTWSYNDWWMNPEQTIPSGAYFSVMRVNGEAKGLSVMLAEPVDYYGSIMPYEYDKRIQIAGFISFFVRKEFRKKGLAVALGQNIENLYLSMNKIKKGKVPVALFGGDAAHVVKKLNKLQYLDIYSGYYDEYWFEGNTLKFTPSGVR